MLLAFHFIDRNSPVSNIARYTMAGLRCIYGGRGLTGLTIHHTYLNVSGVILFGPKTIIPNRRLSEQVSSALE